MQGALVMFRIGEFSRLSQTSVKTLRFYDSIALFKPAHVDCETGYRYYSADQVTELGNILHLKTLGFPLAQIRAVMADGLDPGELRAMLQNKRREIIHRLGEEQLRLAGLDGWLDRLGRPGEAPAHAVTLKRVKPQTVASIRRSISRYSDAVNLFDELGWYAKRAGAGVGPHAAIWHTCGESGGPIDCEAYVVARHPMSGNARISVKELPANVIASVVPRGDADTCAGAYVAVRSWIASHGYKISGPKRELYWRGGLDQDRRSDITEIQFPVAAGGTSRGVRSA
jgi:DNA-binding transcriptional MerR regulator